MRPFPTLRTIVPTAMIVFVAVSCGKKSSGTSTTAGGSQTSGGTSSTYASGTLALTMESVSAAGTNLTNTAGFGLSSAGQVISFTPTKYLFPIHSIILSNSKKSNTLQTPTASGTGTSTTTSTTTNTSGSTSTTTSTATSLLLDGTTTGTSTGTTTGTNTGTSTGTTSTESGSSSSSIDPNRVTLYNCAANTEDGCNIDLADNTAMATAFGTPVNVPVGTFDTISYSVVCTAGLGQSGAPGGYHIGVQGSFQIGGTTYYTTGNGNVLSTTATDLGVAKPTITFCGSDQFTEIKLPTPITVTQGAKVDVSMFMTAQNIAWAGTDGSYNPGGCVNQGNDFACVNLPVVVPTAGSFKPTVETYTINVTNNGLGQVMILADSEGSAFGAFLARLYTATDVAGPMWDAGVESFTKNADGTYDIATGTDPNSSGPRCEFKAFQRATHSGTLYNDGTSLSYTATKQ